MNVGGAVNALRFQCAQWDSLLELFIDEKHLNFMFSAR